MALGGTPRPARRPCRSVLALLLILLTYRASIAAAAADNGVFVRFKLVEPREGKYRAAVSGFRHTDPWYLPTASADVPGDGTWGPWLDLTAWPWHGRLDRAGGVAEWPSIRVTLSRADGAPAAVRGCALAVQLADKPEDPAGVVHSFAERTESDTIAFLVPTPLRRHAGEFETGSHMTARQLTWAREATGGQPVSLDRFTFVTALWGHYDPGLARQAVETLKTLGFNVIGNCDPALLRQAGIRTYATTWLYEPDPRQVEKKWADFAAGPLKAALSTDTGQWLYARAAHWVVGDEVQTLGFAGVEPAVVNGWFRDYLRARGVTDQTLGRSIDQVEYPSAAFAGKTLNRDADLQTRRLSYHAAKFAQWWSAKQLRLLGDQVKATLPGALTETLPSDHGFFNAWGPPHIGMSYRMLDLFELGAQRSVDQLSAEDWLGLNHMYGPEYTWTGAQSFEYFNAICRSATRAAPAGQPIMLRGLITPSDDKYLRLKAYSAIGQGAKSLFFWTFGPTYIGTENYWSDLRSEYDGVAKVGRAVQAAEPVLVPATVVRDPVAILYSVSHDLWHSDDPAAFVEKRLLWHSLRHLHVQPDFLREEDIEAGRLKDYKALFVLDWCVSRAASAKIDQWVRDGGVAYLSAGAATRDEYYDPYVPPFAAPLWPDDAARQMAHESHTYNERTDLPQIKPLTTVSPQQLPVLGCRLNLRPGVAEPFARFADGAPAAAAVRHGRGTVFGVGFLPMLAYGQGAGFKPTTLEEKWPDAPREFVRRVLDAAGVTPAARCDRPVVETSLLTGDKGSAVVLVNYTYQPIDALTVDVKLSHPVTRATSTEGVPVTFEKTADGVRLHLPLAWTDIVLLK